VNLTAPLYLPLPFGPVFDPEAQTRRELTVDGTRGDESLIMRVLLISANTSDINMPTLPLGLVSVATATKAAGHEVEVLDLLAQPGPFGRRRRRKHLQIRS
jgi:hypothetical protein